MYGLSDVELTSVAISAERSLKSPRKICIFMVEILDQSIQKYNNLFFERTSLELTITTAITTHTHTPVQVTECMVFRMWSWYRCFILPSVAIGGGGLVVRRQRSDTKGYSCLAWTFLKTSSSHTRTTSATRSRQTYPSPLQTPSPADSSGMSTSPGASVNGCDQNQ